MRSCFRRIAHAIAMLIMSTNAAPAQTPETAADAQAPIPEKWRIAPYLWGAGISGTLDFQGLSVPVDLSPADLLSDVRAGAMGFARYQAKNHFYYAEGILLDYHDPMSPTFFAQDVKAQLYYGEAGSGLSKEVFFSAEDKITISPYAGVRGTHIAAKVSGEAISASTKHTWWDPVVGVIIETPVRDRLTAITRLDGAGLAMTDNTYIGFTGVLEYAISDQITLSAGYRWSSASYRSKSSLNFDLDANGPLLGISYKPH